jgi:hypothetical protein
MPTTIQFPLPKDIRLQSKTINLDRSFGFGILTCWALILLSIGAFAHFGAQSAESGALDMLALF